MRVGLTSMALLISLGLSLVQSYAVASGLSQIDEDYQVSPGAEPVRDTKSGPTVDRNLVFRTLVAHREDFKRSAFDSATPPLKVGSPLPAGVESEQLPDNVKQALPSYEGYAWRRIGNDIVLIGIASNTFHDIFHNVLRDHSQP